MKANTIIEYIGTGLMLLTVMFGSAGALSAESEVPYRSYVYDTWNQPVETSPGYTPSTLLTGGGLGVGPLKNPADIFISDDGALYILDSGNSRVVVVNPGRTGAKVLLPMDSEGNAITFEEASGIFVCKDGRIHIADKKKQAVFLFDSSLKEIGRLEVPESDILPDDFFYQPIRVVEDSGGIIYVLSSGCYSGALQFDTDFRFMGFYGSEKVTLTSQIFTNYIWKKILTKEQIAGMIRSVPVEFISFDVDSQDFIYTIRRGNDVTTGQVRKLNAMGENIIPSRLFGDTGNLLKLNDICVDADGFITILDQGKCRLYQYDQESNLLYTFGTQGRQLGCFRTPAAVDTFGGSIYVLDSSTASVTVFEPTAFAQDTRKALLLYYDGKYEQAMEPWQAVLKNDNNYQLANLGLGKAYEGLEDYQKAMYYYKKGNDRKLYSSAFIKYRTITIRNQFPVFLLALVLLLLCPVLYSAWRKKRKIKTVYDIRFTRNRLPLYCALHPFIGYSELKSGKNGSLFLANGILAVFFLVTIIVRQMTGFIFNQIRTDRFDIVAQIFSTVGLFAAFVLCNWLVTTIYEGKGSLKEIWIFCSYVLIPFTVLSLFSVLFSNLLGDDEMMFMQIFRFILYGFSGLSLVIALKEVHMYSLKKTIATILLTVAGMMIVLIVCAIGYSIFTQIISFVGTLATEITIR